MNRNAYSKAYQEQKQILNDAIKRFAEENPERFAELQEKAKNELNTPKTRAIHELIRTSIPSFNVSEFIRQRHKQNYLIYTKDCWNDEHLYFESLDNEGAEEVLTRRHPKFTTRREQITKIVPCTCPLCTQLP